MLDAVVGPTVSTRRSRLRANEVHTPDWQEGLPADSLPPNKACSRTRTVVIESETERCHGESSNNCIVISGDSSKSRRIQSRSNMARISWARDWARYGNKRADSTRPVRRHRSGAPLQDNAAREY